jgi:hypothetical protein
MEVWYHVVMLVEPRIVFGFSTVGDIVSKAPRDYEWMIGGTTKEIKPYFLQNKCLITKIQSNNESNNLSP